MTSKILLPGASEPGGPRSRGKAISKWNIAPSARTRMSCSAWLLAPCSLWQCKSMISEKILPELCGVQILSSVLLWNFALSNQLNKLPGKVKKDFVPTLVNGKLVLCCAE